jgi:hypothetical protein
LNLIRVMPAKGQDISMQLSIFLARLIGPIAIAMGLGLLVNAPAYDSMAFEVLRSNALIVLSGVLSMAAGLAIVINHNAWVRDWRLIITILGWLLTIGGALRIVAPQVVSRIGFAMMDTPAVAIISGVVVLTLGVVLCIFGYRRRAKAS